MKALFERCGKGWYELNYNEALQRISRDSEVATWLPLCSQFMPFREKTHRNCKWTM